MRETVRPGLTRRTIIQAALRLLDEVGLEGLTVRRLAAMLDVQSPALYWHFRNKQELLDGMADAIVVAAGMGPPREGESWQAWLERRARAYRASLLAHRDSARIVANARLSLRTISLFEAELSAMVGRGFTAVVALRTIVAVTAYSNGFVLQEQTQRDESASELAALAGALDIADSATLLMALREGGRPFSDDAFEHGLHAIIEGTAYELAHHRFEPRPA